MDSNKTHIDPFLFERQFEAFKIFVKEKSGIQFTSFASNPYTENQEGYKYGIYSQAREALGFQTWKNSEIGSGKILASVIKAIEIRDSNLVPWQARFGPESRPHHELYVAHGDPIRTKEIETIIFQLYRDNDDSQSFGDLISIFGKTYPLLAYLLFIKDRSKYLPIAPTNFDKAFKILGVEFKTSHGCSWENYSIYLGLIKELKTLLAEAMLNEVTLLDAHSFSWMLATKMETEGKLANVQEYLGLSVTERDAIVKARIGQGRFRESLINYWSTCAVTECSLTSLLRASHIKPWSKASPLERLSHYNGLLLTPALDACFDSGVVSFDKEGHILISPRLSKENALTLSISPEMKLRKLEPGHEAYLAYHRDNIFK